MRRTVVVVNSYPLVRSGIDLVLRDSGDLEVVGEADSGRAAYRLVDQLSPDLVVLEFTPPDEEGITATREIRQRCGDTRILLLSGPARPEQVAYALAAGADGMLLKSQPAEEVRTAARAVLAGQRYLAPSVDRDAVERLVVQRCKGVSIAPLDQLSTRERDVFALQTRGLSAKEIGRRLCISEKTVQTHRARIFRKLNVHSGVELVRFAAAHGLLAVATPAASSPY